MTSPGPSKIEAGAVVRNVELRMDRFGWEALERQSGALGVPEEELLRFALLYYIADIDSGRVARRIAEAPLPTPGQ